MCNDKESYIMNRIAVKELNDGNEEKALKLMRNNLKKYPGTASYNNYGIYCHLWGMLQKNGKVRCAHKLGIRYLRRAHECGVDWRNIVSLATALSDYLYPKKDFCESYKLFQEAYTFNHDPRILYDIGVCLYNIGLYDEALKTFNQFETDSAQQIVNNQGIHPLLASANCAYNLGLISDAHEKLIEYITIFPVDKGYNWEEPVVFELMFRTGEKDLMYALCDHLLRTWCPTDIIIALLADMLNNKPTFLEQFLKAAEDLPELPEQVRSMQLDNEKRMSILQENHFNMPLIDLFCYIDSEQ